MKVRDLTELQWVRAVMASGEGRRIREGADVSQAEAGSPAGVVGSTVAHWEAGRRKPTGEPALRYAGVLRALDRAAKARTSGDDGDAVA